MTPDFTILAAGVDITSQIRDRLLSLTITDAAGVKSDSVEIVLDDRGGAIELPLPGAPLVVAMGDRETFLMPMGVYTSDEIGMDGWPQTMTLRGKAANLGGPLKEQKKPVMGRQDARRNRGNHCRGARVDPQGGHRSGQDQLCSSGPDRGKRYALSEPGWPRS